MLNNENDLGYCAYLCWSLSKEKPSGFTISTNKFGLKEYVELFPEGLEAVELKRKEREPRLGVPDSRPPLHPCRLLHQYLR